MKMIDTKSVGNIRKLIERAANHRPLTTLPRGDDLRKEIAMTKSKRVPF